jgi:hypothetical protein
VVEEKAASTKKEDEREDEKEAARIKREDEREAARAKKEDARDKIAEDRYMESRRSTEISQATDAQKRCLDIASGIVLSRVIFSYDAGAMEARFKKVKIARRAPLITRTILHQMKKHPMLAARSIVGVVIVVSASVYKLLYAAIDRNAQNKVNHRH